MKNTLLHFLLTTLLLLGTTSVAVAADQTSLPAVGGYDVVSYFTDNEAVRGSGFHTAVHEGQSYLFSSEENKKKFEASPERYLPEFGGWCAYGVALGKKFHVDPTVFEIVDGKLYLNLDSDIQEKWAAEKKKNITTAHTNWKKIQSTSAVDL